MPLLDEEDPRLRFAAVRALGQIRNAAAAPRLLALLSDSHKELRFAAIEALGQIRAPAAVLPLVEALRDGDRNLRRAAAEALGEIRDPQAVPALLIALDDDHWSVRCGAAAALGRLGSPKAIGALSLRVEDPDPTVCRAAVTALGEIGDPRAAGRLVRALEEPALQPAALEALRRLGPPALPEIERAFVSGALTPEVRRLLVDLAGRLEDVATRRLLLAGLEDPSPAVRKDAAIALGEGGFREALRPCSTSSPPTLRRRSGRPPPLPSGSCSRGEVPDRRPRCGAERGGVSPAARLHPRAVRALLRRLAPCSSLRGRLTPRLALLGLASVRGLPPLPAVRARSGRGAAAHGEPPHQQRDLLLSRAAAAQRLRQPRAARGQGAQVARRRAQPEHPLGRLLDRRGAADARHDRVRQRAVLLGLGRAGDGARRGRAGAREGPPGAVPPELAACRDSAAPGTALHAARARACACASPFDGR